MARWTKETGTVAGTDTFAVGTGLASHVRIDKNCLLPLHLCFVSNHILQLPKSPAINPSVKSFSHVFIPASSDVRQVLKDEHISCADDLFADSMVEVAHVTFPSARQSLKLSSGRLCAFALQSSSQPLMLLDSGLMARENISLACDGEVVYSDINTNNFLRVTVSSDVFGDCDVKEPSSLLVFDEHCSLEIPTMVFRVVFGDVKRNINSLVVGSNSYLIPFETCKSFVKKNRSRFDKWFRTSQVFGTLGAFKSPSNSIHSKLRFKIKSASKFLIDKAVKREFMFNVVLPTSIDSELNGLLIRIRNSLNLRDFLNLNFHRDTHKLNNKRQYLNLSEERAFLQPLKRLVSYPTII